MGGNSARNRVTYARLVAKLTENGISEKEANIASELVRGELYAGFLVRCLEAIGVTELRL